MQPSRLQEAVQKCETDGATLVEKVRSLEVSDDLTRLTRDVVDANIAVGTSEPYFRQADRYRALGQEEEARAAQETAQAYNESGIALMENTIPNILDNLKSEFQDARGDTVASANNAYQEALHQQLRDMDVDLEDAQRIEQEVGESLDAAGATIPGIIDQLSTKVAQWAEVRSSPDRGMVRHSPGPVLVAAGVVLVITGVVVNAACAWSPRCRRQGTIFALGTGLIMIGGLYFLASLALIRTPAV